MRTMSNILVSSKCRLIAAALVMGWPTAGLGAGATNISQTPNSGSSSWDIGLASQVRLIAAKTAIAPKSKAAKIGVQIKLKPGWKTYWRTPGDSGVPPQFSWKGSQNLKSANILWPAPHWLKDEFGVSIGYKKQVVFPVEITPVDASKPVHLNLSLNYAACKEVCIPVQAKLSLKLVSGFAVSTLNAGLISQFTAQVPNAKPTVRDASIIRVIRANKPKTTIAIDVKSDPKTTAPSLFVEGPKDYYFSKPVTRLAPKEGRQRYLVRVDGLDKKKQLKGMKLRITIVEKERSSEHEVTIQ